MSNYYFLTNNVYLLFINCLLLFIRLFANLRKAMLALVEYHEFLKNK